VSEAQKPSGTGRRDGRPDVRGPVGPRRIFVALFVMLLLIFPFVASPFHLDLSCQAFIAAIAALALMQLTGFAGQISLGHAGLLAAGAFTVGILSKETGAGFWITIPAAAVTGALLGFVFGLPSLRLRGLYLAVSTLALHFLVVYAAGEYETKRGFSTGILVDPPRVFGYEIYDPKAWYFVLLALLAFVLWLISNLLRFRTGKAWGAIRANDTVAEALGINIARYKLLAFIVSSSITAVAGALFAYYRGFVSVEAFSLYLAIQYIAMVIVGGMGSLVGALLGAAFITVFPYVIEGLLMQLPGSQSHSSSVFAVNYAMFGVMMIFFLLIEPGGLVGLWHRIFASRAVLALRRKTGLERANV
jgi:branched-chain amino acid transport system permease protein